MIPLSSIPCADMLLLEATANITPALAQSQAYRQQRCNRPSENGDSVAARSSGRNGASKRPTTTTPTPTPLRTLLCHLPHSTPGPHSAPITQSTLGLKPYHAFPRRLLHPLLPFPNRQWPIRVLHEFLRAQSIARRRMDDACWRSWRSWAD